MAVVQLKRHLTGANFTPSGLYAGEMVFDCVSQKLYIGNGDDGFGRATSITTIGGNGSFVTAAMLGAANGIPLLDASGHIPSTYLANLFTGLVYKGVWDASANSPPLASGSGTSGFFYKVSNAGTTNLDGNNSWAVGDTLLFDGKEWAKIGSGAATSNGTTTSGITNVNGYTTSTVNLKASDLADVTAAALNFLHASSVMAQRQEMGLDTAASIADANYTMIGGIDFNAQFISISAPRVLGLPAAALYNPGTKLLIGDRSGNVTSTNTVTLTATSTGNKINGNTTLVLLQSFGQVFLECDGVSKYTVISQPSQQTTPAVIDGGVI